MDTFDLIVIGAGPGGYVAAIRAAQLGMKTALVEKDAALGGTCLNVGCIPSKALLESSEQFHAAGHAFAAHGITAENVKIDLAAMMARKTTVVKTLTDGVATLMKKNKVTVVRGLARLSGPGKVSVTVDGATTEYGTKFVLIATGSVPVQLPFLPFDGERVVTSTEALSFTEVPKRLAVIGAGAVGLELGSVWNRLGSQVTVVELLPNITPFADTMASKFLQRALAAQGMEIKLQHKVTGAEVGPSGVVLKVEDPKGQPLTVEADKVLVSVGRKPCTDTAGLREAGIVFDGPRVAIDDHFRTNLEGVYAIGDVVRGPMLAHKAEEEGIAAVEIMAGKAGHVNYDVIPNVVYTHPELAMVGITEEQAKAEKVPVKVGRFYFAANGRALSLGETDGLCKVVAHAETDRLLGVHIVGVRASDMIAEAAAFLEFKASAEDVARTCHAHPTLSEILKEACMAVDKRAIHG